MDNQMWYVCHYNENYSTTKKLYSGSYYHVNEPQYNYAKWKKQDIKGHIIYDSIYMKYIE